MSETPQSAVLVDDDVFHRLNWQRAVGGSDFKSFGSVDEFVTHFSAGAVPNDRIVFLDYELNDGTHASENARKIMELGFKTIFITTAHDARAIEPIAGISGIISKEPPAWLTVNPGPAKLEDKFTKISAEQRKALGAQMDAGAKQLLKMRLEALQTAMFTAEAEIVIDTWERAIFEGVSDEALAQRIEESRTHASK